jgi:hypothetical protein
MNKIQTVKLRHKKKIYIYETKNINLYFLLLGGFLFRGLCPGAFVLDPNMGERNGWYLISTKSKVNLGKDH